MVRYVMTIILALGRNMKWIMTLTLCMMPMNKILYIIYIYGSLNQPMDKKILWSVTKLFIYQIMGYRGVLFIVKGR